jgi:hypothetical protein
MQELLGNQMRDESCINCDRIDGCESWRWLAFPARRAFPMEKI